MTLDACVCVPNDAHVCQYAHICMVLLCQTNISKSRMKIYGHTYVTFTCAYVCQKSHMCDNVHVYEMSIICSFMSNIRLQHIKVYTGLCVAHMDFS